MTIRYKCEECGSTLKIKGELAGTAGKCPKCKTAFTIPQPDETAAQKQPEDAAEVSEEDAMFGEDFFKMDDAPQRPKYVVPEYSTTTDEIDDDSEDDPAPPANKPFGAAKPSAVDNSSNVAGALLSKTGKKNRPDDWEEEDDDKVGYDFGELNYLLKTRIIPCLVILLFVVPGLYYMFAGMMSDGLELPPLAPVSGSVTVDGTPVSATIRFLPDATENEETGGGSTAISGADGSYVAMYKQGVEGAILGKHRVEIVAAGFGVFRETVEIIEGPNQKDFNLTRR